MESLLVNYLFIYLPLFLFGKESKLFIQLKPTVSNTICMSAGIVSFQTADVSFSKANFATEWAWALQFLGTKRNLTFWNSLLRYWILETIQWIVALQSFVLFTSSTNSLQSNSMIKEDETTILATCKPHSIASASAILTLSFKWDWFMPAATTLPSKSVITAANRTFWSGLLLVASTLILKTSFRGGIHFYCFSFLGLSIWVVLVCLTPWYAYKTDSALAVEILGSILLSLNINLFLENKITQQ